MKNIDISGLGTIDLNQFLCYKDQIIPMKTDSKEDNMAYCNKHERAYPMTLGCPDCKLESQ